MARLSLAVCLLLVLAVQLSLAYKQKSGKESYKKERGKEEYSRKNQREVRSAQEEWKPERGNRETQRVMSNSKRIKKEVREPVEDCPCNERFSKKFTKDDEEQRTMEVPAYRKEKRSSCEEARLSKKNAKVAEEGKSCVRDEREGVMKKQKHSKDSKKQEYLKMDGQAAKKSTAGETAKDKKMRNPVVLEENNAEEEYSAKSKNLKTSKKRFVDEDEENRDDEEAGEDEIEDQELYDEDFL